MSEENESLNGVSQVPSHRNGGLAALIWLPLYRVEGLGNI
jgi:hypothetical protein